MVRVEYSKKNFCYSYKRVAQLLGIWQKYIFKLPGLIPGTKNESSNIAAVKYSIQGEKITLNTKLITACKSV